MRYLIVSGANQTWILFVKEMVCVISVGMLILFLTMRGQYFFPKLRWLLYILIGGVTCELFGSQLNLMSLDLAGLVICVPIIQSATMVFTALYGFLFLKEKLDRQTLAAIGILLIGMICLVVSPKFSSGVMQTLKAAPPITLILGGIWAVLGGMAYGVHIIYLRVTARSFQMPVTLIMIEITGIGAVIFFFGFLQSHSFQPASFWENIPPKYWLIGVMNGVFNTIAFYFQINGLRYLLAARAQVIAIAQIVVGTLAGIFFFGEPTNFMIWLGMFLIAAGIILVSFVKNLRNKSEHET